MSETLDRAVEVPPVDPGCLPAWDVDEMPEPKPFRARNWIALIGPGLVLAGGSIGTGEWVMGPKTAALYGGAMLWVVIVSILAQVALNTEAMRYTLCTGEPILTGFMRCKPGPRFWLGFYLVLDIGAWWPSLASLSAQIIVVMVQGLTPADTVNTETVRYVSYGVFLLCGSMALFGGKIYNTLQFVMGSKFLFLLGYMTLCTLFFVSLKTWGQVWSGLLNPFRPLPEGKEVDWTLVAALAGYAGVGGIGNIMVSNFVREKGWGMGSKVGAIPSVIGGHQITLSHIGTMCRPGAETVRRFKGWYQYLIVDQYLLWALGSLIGMLLPCAMGLEYLNAKSLQTNDQWRWAAAMAQDFGAVHGNFFRNMTLICGLIILIPGQFYVVDNVARRWTDALWSGSRRTRRLDNNKIRHVYYAFAGGYLLFGVAAYTFFPKLSGTNMMIIAGNMANLAITATIFQTIYVNQRFLPPELRPSRAKQVVLVLAGLFFLSMFCLVVKDISKKIRDKNAPAPVKPMKTTLSPQDALIQVPNTGRQLPAISTLAGDGIRYHRRGSG